LSSTSMPFGATTPGSVTATVGLGVVDAVGVRVTVGDVDGVSVIVGVSVDVGDAVGDDVGVWVGVNVGVAVGARCWRTSGR
jgi:hypothetical protein